MQDGLNQVGKVGGIKKVSSLDDKSRIVMRKRLRCLLKEHGQLPSKYRARIWSSLLGCPFNEDSFRCGATAGGLSVRFWADCTYTVVRVL